MTTVLVTHDREEALAMSERVALLFQGRLSQCGTPEEVYAHPRDRRTADYFGGCVYFPGVAEGGVFRADGFSLPAALPDGAATLCLRGGAWTLSEDGTDGLPCRVESLRFVGDGSLLTLRTASGAALQKRLESSVSLAPGDTVRIRIDPNRAIYFTGEDTP